MYHDTLSMVWASNVELGSGGNKCMMFFGYHHLYSIDKKRFDSFFEGITCHNYL